MTPEVCEIPLSRGLVTVVDAADYESVTAAGSWYAMRAAERPFALYYATRNVPSATTVSGRTSLRLHVFLTGWRRVDHVNRDSLDNRRANLREYTSDSFNRANITAPRNNTSGFKGVYFHRQTGRWAAQIGGRDARIGGRPSAHIGLFDTPEAAALAYDREALATWGEFACLNFQIGRAG